MRNGLSAFNTNGNSHRPSSARVALAGSLALAFALASCSGRDSGHLINALSASALASAEAAPACDAGAPAATDGPIRSAYRPGQLDCLCKTAIAKARARFDAVASVAPGDRTFENTTMAYENANADFGDESNPLYFMREVTTDQRTHDESLACVNEIQTFLIGMGARRDLYEALKDGAPEAGVPDFDAKARLHRLTVLGFERSGLKLSDPGLAELTELQQQLADKQTTYSDNLAKDHPTLTISASEATGLSAAFLDRTRTPSGDYAIEVNEPNYSEVVTKAANGDVRKRFQLAFTNLGGAANVTLLNEAVAIRARMAQILGYATYADYATEMNMAKSGRTVDAFLEDLRSKLQPRIQAENADLLAYKKRLDPTATELFPWDIGYLSYQIKKNELKVDDDLVREYFPADVVMKGLFEVYSTLLNVTYREVKDATAWAPGVALYEIHEGREGANKGALIGYFYADLAPRALKYNHAAAFSLIQGRRLANGAYNKPVSSIVANITPAGGGKPPLLAHDEVVTVFHEFGHIMHQTLTRAQYASLSGSGVAQDFVEAPSQMLENWVWQPEILAKLSGKYDNPGETLPQGLLEQLLKARDFGRGTFYAKQALYARWDMTIHESAPGAPVDAQATYDRMYLETVGLQPLVGTHLASNFGHLMGGYAAGYYGYLWSDVYASDMFTQFEGHTLDPQVGGRYRSEILERGNMVDADVLLRNFLGREPNNEAFLRKLGIAAAGH